MVEIKVNRRGKLVQEMVRNCGIRGEWLRIGIYYILIKNTHTSVDKKKAKFIYDIFINSLSLVESNIDWAILGIFQLLFTLLKP